MFTLEDHGVACGFGSAVAELALSGERQAEAGKLAILGLPDRFIDHGDRTEQLAAGGIDVDRLTMRVRARLDAVRPTLEPAKRATGGARR
jgi:1-deoxy-D-xylulose-5-phosphate synthase